MGSLTSALRGWPHAMTERNFRILLVCGLIALCLLSFFGVPAREQLPVIILIVVTLAAEIFNSAIEEVADALIQEHHPGIARSKELTAGGVLLLALTTLFVALAILYPYLPLHG